MREEHECGIGNELIHRDLLNPNDQVALLQVLGNHRAHLLVLVVRKYALFRRLYNNLDIRVVAEEFLHMLRGQRSPALPHALVLAPDTHAVHFLHLFVWGQMKFVFVLVIKYYKLWMLWEYTHLCKLFKSICEEINLLNVVDWHLEYTFSIDLMIL